MSTLLSLLLACESADPGPYQCVRDDDPPGDPIYRDCVITGESHSDTTEQRTDSEGRTTFYLDDDWIWEHVWDGDCEAETTRTCTRSDGSSCGTWSATRVCDAHANPTTVTEAETTALGNSYTTTTETTYDYDADGRAVVAVSTVRGSDDPPSTRTCTYNDFDLPDQCVENPTSDDDTTDDTTFVWTYDREGNALSYDLSSLNPGYSASLTWERDADGRTTASSHYDTASSDRIDAIYSYRGLVLDIRSWTASGYGFASGPFETVYSYARNE